MHFHRFVWSKINSQGSTFSCYPVDGIVITAAFFEMNYELFVNRLVLFSECCPKCDVARHDDAWNSVIKLTQHGWHSILLSISSWLADCQAHLSNANRIISVIWSYLFCHFYKFNGLSSGRQIVRSGFKCQQRSREESSTRSENLPIPHANFCVSIAFVFHIFLLPFRSNAVSVSHSNDVPFAFSLYSSFYPRFQFSIRRHSVLCIMLHL